MRFAEIITEDAGANVVASAEITRWVDEKGALSYIRSNAMIGRVRHWLPKQLTGLDKSYPKTGLSFGIPTSRSSWNAHGGGGICFVVERARLANLVCNIDGDAIYNFTQAYDDHRFYDRENMELYRKNAIEDSLRDPDEAFVVGDIRDLGSKLSRIIIGKRVRQPVIDKIMAYADARHIQVEQL